MKRKENPFSSTFAVRKSAKIFFINHSIRFYFMKRFLLGAAVLTLAFTACKKDDNNGASGSLGNFKVGSTTYVYDGVNTEFKADSGIFTISGLSGTSGGSIDFYFQQSTMPPAAGTYRLAAFDTTRTAGQVAFLATAFGGTPSGLFGSTGLGNVNVTVSITNGKYKIVLPDAPAINILNDSVSTNVSANVTQK